MTNSTPQQSQKSWFAFAAILAGFILVAIGGLLVLSWVSSAAASAASATALPAAQTPSTEPPAQGATAESSPTGLQPTVAPTALPTRPKPTEAVSQDPTATPAADQFQLTVIHSNDTWGYVEPCG